MPSQKGSTALIILFVILAVIIVAAGAYYLNTQRDNSSQPTKNPQTTNIPTSSPVVQLENWKTFTDENNHFSFQYPPDWLVETCQQLWVFLAPTKELMGNCGNEGENRYSDFAGGGLITMNYHSPLAVNANPNSVYNESINKPLRYTNLSYLEKGKREDVFVSGNPAIIISGVYRKTTDKGVHEGNKLIEYVIKTEDGPMTVTYESLPEWGDNTAVFQSIISTLKFTKNSK